MEVVNVRLRDRGSKDVRGYAHENVKGGEHGVCPAGPCAMPIRLC